MESLFLQEVALGVKRDVVPRGAHVFMRFTLNISDTAPAPLEPTGVPLVNIRAFMGLLFLAVNWINCRQCNTSLHH